MLPIFHRHSSPSDERATSTTKVPYGHTHAVLDAVDGVIALHDRTIQGLPARIDHIVVGRDAVWVIDCRRYAARTVRADGYRLRVGGFDATALVEGADRRAGIVRVAAAAVLGTAPVRPVLCFEGPVALGCGGPEAIGPVTIARPEHLAALVGGYGPITERAAHRIAAVTGHGLPAAFAAFASFTG